MRVTNERLAELLRYMNAGDETAPSEPGNVLLDIRDERALSDRLAEALRHARYRDHQHRPESCAGCREVENAIAAHDKERGR